ncbi:hypothetical protein B0A50_04397 [Salinomyces thailandicus]|uniref:F-box domain-containing protein n=1 Tax=Salinomyces thailandicus TaxID=706561 RepID=A0A4U0TZU0_9PEZI|nr:hypothetical protein B0A50_04397 [Salinomyces thailandica]
MASLTPIRIRGKRTGTKAEKGLIGKRRKVLKTSSSSTYPHGAEPPVDLSSRKRKRRERQLSRIEELPTEILQDIFYLAGNLNLALVSPSLQSQLSSTHVYLAHTSRTLRPVLGPLQEEDRANVSELSAASRLMSCRFFTWSFFKQWLAQSHHKMEDQHATSSSNAAEEYTALWRSLEPRHGLLPPLKVLHGPWTSDKVEFLGVMASSGEDLAAINPVHGETAYEGLGQAISEQSELAVRHMLRLQLNPDTELLRQAVIKDGCNREIVEALVGRAMRQMQSSAGPPQRTCDIDFLDPVLWAWAERARGSGDERGDWLSALLKEKNGEVWQLDTQ